MPFVVCNRQSKNILTWVARETVPFNSVIEVGFPIDREPDLDKEIWNGAVDLRLRTAAEKQVVDNNVKDSKSDINNIDPLAKAIALVFFDEINILRVNAGLTPRTRTQLKTAIRSKL